MQQYPPTPPPAQNWLGQQNQAVPDPQANAQDGQANANGPLNVVAPYTGWYPRWWLLAAFCCSIIISLMKLLWQPLICSDDSLPLCGFVDRASFWMILPMWLFFIVLWYVILAASVGRVEFPRRGGSPLGIFLRTISQFHSLRTLIIGQSIIAFLLINVLWWLNRTTPLTFAMLAIIVFVGHCCFFHPLEVEMRRLSLFLYGIIALMLLVLETTLRPRFFTHMPPSDEWPLLLTQLALFIVGIIALINTFRYRPEPAQTAIDARNQSIDDAISVGVVLRSVWPVSRILPVRPVPHQNQQGNQNQPNQPDPQTRQNNRRPQGT